MEDCIPDPYFKDITIPLLFLRPASEMERDSSLQQFELAESHGHNNYVYVAQYGVHGAFMLVEKRVGDDVSASWNVVKLFLSFLQ